MKRKEVYLLWCVAMLASVPAMAVIPVPLPSLNFEVSPSNPSPSQDFSVTVKGMWPDACPPISLEAKADPNTETMRIDLLLPGYFDPNCDEEDCGTESSSWELVADSVGPFPAGRYEVQVRAVDCNETGEYEKTSFVIQIGPGGGNGNGDGGGGQQPGRRFARGERVVLLADDPITGLSAGRAGTIVCCDNADCAGRVLVSWDFFAAGRDDATNCVDSSFLAFPTGSVTWVDTRAMMLGRPFNACGVIRKGLEGCIYFEADDGRDYAVFDSGDLYTELDTTGGVDFDDRVRLRGVIDTTVPDPNTIRICPARDGDIYHPILSECRRVEVGCCGGELFPGDRVTLRVNNPREPGGTGAPDLMSGATGTVVCCGGTYGSEWVFVSWDDWTDGVNADASCDSNIIAYVRNSGWWVLCDQIDLTGGGGGGNGNGGDGYVVRVGSNALRLQSENPQGPLSAQNLSGCTNATVESNFRVQLSVEVSASSAAGGTWTGTITPDVIDPGTTVVEICVRGENVDLTAVPPGANRQLANVSVFGVPAP